MITINGRKMGKSYNNVIKLTELFSGDHPELSQAYHPMVVRFFILQSHYRSTLDFSNEALQAAEKGLKRLWDAYEKLQALVAEPGSTGTDAELVAKIVQTKMLLPVAQRGLGRAKGTGPVDRGGAAHAAPLQNGDALVGGFAAGAFLVERGVGLGLALVEVAAALERPFFDEDDLQARAGQQFGGDPRPGARTHNGYVAGYAGG